MQTTFDFDAPPTNHSPTSNAAAESISRARRETDCARILAFIIANCGATREEIELATGIRGNTVRPRCLDLIDAGRVYESAVTRKTTSGRKAFVLKAKEAQCSS